jgi:hypothetical protein
VTTAADHLRARLDSLDDAVASLREFVAAPPPAELGELSDHWHALGESVRRSFTVEADHLDRQIEQAREKFAASGDGADSSTVWGSVTSIEDQARGLADEAMLFANGALQRCLGLDDGFCAVVDLLLAEVAKDTNVAWDRISVPATGHVTSGRTELIGVRLYDRTIWSMPLAVHELGHFAAERLGFRRQRTTADVVAASPAPRDFGEHFADLYAAVALGPAYLATLIERADPSNVERPREHPVWHERVYLVSSTMRRRAGPELTRTLDRLRSFWEQCCASAHRSPWPADEVRTELDTFAEQADDALRRSTPAESLEPSWRDVERATEELQRGVETPSTTSFRVVVNAAWRGRLRLERQGLPGAMAAVELERRARRWFDVIRG